MQDTYPSHRSNEQEPIAPNLELITNQIYDVSCIRHFQVRKDKDGNEIPLEDGERFRLLSDIAQYGPLEQVLDRAGYSREDGEFDDDSIALVRIGLMTPNYIVSQTALDQIGIAYQECKKDFEANRNDETKRAALDAKKAELRATLIELTNYNAVLKETIRAYPNLGARKLATFLQGDAMGMDLPEDLRKQSEIQLSRVINGARSEIIFEDTVKSPAMKEAGITYGQTSTQEDVWGIDCVADVVFGKGKEQVVVNLPIDVKSTSKQVDIAAKSNRALSVQSPAYAIKDNAVIMWCGVDLNNLHDNLLPTPERLEENAKRMAPIIRMAAYDYEIATRKGFVESYYQGIAVAV